MIYATNLNGVRIWRIPPSMIEGKTYYANERGHVETTAGHELKDQFGPSERLNKGGSKQLHLKIAGKERKTHRLVCAARWGLPRKGQDCHHLNGNKFDNRPDNLIWLSKPRHRHYDARLKALKALLTFQGVLIFSRRDFIRFARMSESNFQSMLAEYRRVDPHDLAEREIDI